MRRLPVGLLALAILVMLVAACRGGAHTPRDVKIPLLTPTSTPQQCINDRYPAEAPQFGGDQFEYRTLGSGVQVADLEQGTGPTPTSDNTVLVRFTGFLPDGCIFTSSYVQAEPVRIELGGSILGLREGVSTMQVGGKRRMRIPPDLAYGPQGIPGRVPPNSIIIFMVDLQGILEESATSTPAATP